jgi:hypothetical protein
MVVVKIWQIIVEDAIAVRRRIVLGSLFFAASLTPTLVPRSRDPGRAAAHNDDCRAGILWRWLAL